MPALTATPPPNPLSVSRRQCLIPEVPFTLYGERGMFTYLEKVLSEKGHAVICVAEGAGQVGVPEGGGGGAPRGAGAHWAPCVVVQTAGRGALLCCRQYMALRCDFVWGS